MPWNRNDPDPLEARRRQLAEQARLLDEQRRLLTEQLQQSGDAPTKPKTAEPPVWRMEDDGHHKPFAEPTPARKRNLARQRQRDMALVFSLVILLVIILGIALWVARVHINAPVTGA